MKFRNILSALLHLFALSPAALADATHNVPTSVSGGSGTVSAIQADDGIFYSVAGGNTINIAGFTPVGGDISSVVLHVKFSVGSGDYAGTNPIQVNGVNTPIIPTDGDTQRTASIDIISDDFRINTWPEITTLAVTFANNDSNPDQSVHFDHAYLVINHTTPLFAPPTWSDEFDDSGPPNPAVWTFEQGFVRNQELQWYQSNNAWQQNGNLIIEGRRLPANTVLNPNYVAGSTDWRTNRQYINYTSSSIQSQGKYSFQYGRMQVRAKIPCFPGAWPAIWTLGNSGEWPSNGECDILEYYATDSVLANLARGTNTRWSAAWDAVKKPVSTFTGVNPNWRTEYHVWTMQWDDQNVRLYIDNHLMNTTAQSWLVNPVTTWGPKNPFKQPHFLLLNLALGGAGGNPDGTTFPLRYEIDHVRVWEGLTGNNAPADIALSTNTVPEGMPGGTVVGNLTATDVDAAEVHGFGLVTGAGDTHNSSFELVFNSDQTKTSVLRTKAVLNSADGATRSIRARVTDIEGATYDKILTVQIEGQYVIEVAPATLSAPEGGNNTFGVRLRVAPTADVTVNVSRLSGDADLNVTSGSSLVFTPLNGTAWQTVTLSAAEDADRTNGTATFLCNDASGAFLNATVIASETDNEPPPIQAFVILSNLNQTFDGYMKSVTVTTMVNGVPQNLSHDLTYGGQFMMPTDAGTYEVVATITDPDHQGSASGTLVIAKAAQTINFSVLGPVPDNAAPFALTANASSNLTVSYALSNTNVATLSGDILTIAGPGSTIITASQAGDDNYNAAASVPQTLTVFRANPLAVTTGPYLVLFNQSLSLNGEGSQPSDGQTITDYSWDLNGDGVFGDLTGATPASVSYADLIATWGMVDGLNTVAMQVTDSAGKTSIVSTTVEVVVILTWDSNGTTAPQTDGAGDWTATDQWWNGTTHSTWTSGIDAIFGNGGAGGDVTLAGPTAVRSLTFNSYTGSYTLGTAGQTITLKNGIIKNTGIGAASIISPINLIAAQSWTNHSAGLLTIGPDAVTNGGFLLSVGGTGNTAVSGAIGGEGGLTKSGAGILSLTGSIAYAGNTTVSGGTLVLTNANTISAGTSVAATGTLQLGHATSMGTSTMTLASGATLQLRNDTNTTFTAPIATAPTTAVTYNFDVNNAGGAVTNKTLSLGNLTFAASFSGSVTNRINVTGGNGYTLRLGTLSAPSGGGAAHPLIINPTSAAVAISRVTSGSYGTALTFTGSNAATLGDFVLGSNGWQSLIVNGPTVTLGTTSATGDRTNNGATAAFTLTSGTLNLTTNSSIANLTWYASGDIVAPTFRINGGTLNNTSGTALNLGTSTSGYFNNNPTITLGGNFAFGTSSSTSANNLNLGTGAVTLSGSPRTVTINGTTTLTLGGAGGGAVALTKAGTGTLTLNGANTYSLGTTVSGGTLQIGGAGNLMTGNYTQAISIASGATLQYSSSAGQALSGAITGAGRLIKDTNTSDLGLSNMGNNFASAHVGAGRIVVSAAAHLSSGATSIVQSGSGQLFVSAAVTLSNPMNISGTGFPEPGDSQNNINGAIRLSGSTLSGTITLSGNSRIGVLGSSTNIISGQITGGFGIDFYGFQNTINAAPTFVITNTNNNYTGATTIYNSNYNTTNLTGVSTTLRLGASNVIPDGANAGSVAFAINGANNDATIILDLNGFNETINGLTVHAGTFATRITNAAATASILTIGANDTTSSFSGTITDGGANGTLALSKIGTGSLTLSGANTYIGATTVSEGTLLVTSPGSLAAASAVTVGTGTGGTLGGNGTIHGNVTVAANGSLAPGDSIGTLTIGGTLDISAPANGGTGKLNFELDALANTNDRIAVAGNLSIGVDALGFNDFVFTNPGGLQVTGGTPYTLITSGGLAALNTLDPANLTGTLPGGLIGTLQINGNNIELAVTSGNTAPIISEITNQSVPSGGNTGPLAFTITDEDANSVTPSGSSSNPALVPNGTIVFGGIGASRTVTVTPVSGLSGSAIITVTLTDIGSLTVQHTFLLTVTDNYLSWSTLNGVTGGENDDSDNDGVMNLVEYALVDGGERGEISGHTITFTKRAGVYGSDITYDIEISTLLTAGSWSSLAKPPVVESADSISYPFTPGSPVMNFARLKVVKAP